ncbi:MAG: hypothetical protein ACREK7_04650 [Gemmatimonadota bacterium]
MTRTRWVALITVLLIAVFAVVVGGFLWPRPQFRLGPWTGPGAVPADSGRALDEGPPGE